MSEPDPAALTRAEQEIAALLTHAVLVTHKFLPWDLNMAIVQALAPLVASLRAERDEARILMRDLAVELAHDKAGGWRCFHCQTNFTEEREAREHFGTHSAEPTACVTAVQLNRALSAGIERAEAAESALADLRAAAQALIAALDRKDIWDDDQGPVPILQAAGEAVGRLRALLSAPPDERGGTG